jgi:predicted enzyme related to lactoylglutathione lyase
VAIVKRLDRLDVATSDLTDAAQVYERNFGFSVRRAPGSDEAIVAVGGSEIWLRTGAAVAEMLAAAGEGLAALWLEADDVERVAEAFDRAGLAHQPIRNEDGRRVLAVDPKAANMVPLFIFDRKV